MKKRLCATTSVVIILIILLKQISAADDPGFKKTSDPGVVPVEGYVPNAKTAIKIAEAVVEPVYGLQVIRNEQPFKARLVGGEWFVKGSGPTNVDWKGGVVEVHISKTNGCITFLLHGR
jgi:hypothetical protein